jgi:hypothetical protein
MTVEEINKLLVKHFGVNDDKRPLFRIVWSNDQLETRWGTFREFYGPIFLRETTGVCKDRHKYPWIRDRWILERLTFPASKYRHWSPELIGVENGSYEIIWKFETPNEEYQYPIWQAVKCIIASLFATKEKLTQADLDRMEAEMDEKDVVEDMMKIEENSPTLSGQLRDGSAIIAPGVN